MKLRWKEEGIKYFNTTTAITSLCPYYYVLTVHIKVEELEETEEKGEEKTKVGQRLQTTLNYCEIKKKQDNLSAFLNI